MELNEFLNEFPNTLNSDIKRTADKVFQASVQVSCLFYFKERKSTNFDKLKEVDC